MKNTILMLMTLFSTFSNAQTKKPSTTKDSKPEIDILYEKYKDKEDITLFTPHGNLYGNVSVEFNEDEKPVSVSIQGNSENKPAIAEFISNTIKMKLKQGYKPTKVPFGWNAWTYAELVE